MRIALDLLGHHLEFSIDHPGDESGPGERESTLDALVERSDPYSPPIGFYPHRHNVEDHKENP